jgi:heme a synthase
MRADSITPFWLRQFTKLTAASTLFLIFAGAMVTSTSSGLAVPDWPLSYGQLMPPMVGGIFYEHGHRMIATFVGLLTLIQAFWLQFREPKRAVRLLGWTSLVTVIVQGVLGGLTVLFLLPTAISVSHAALAQIFLGLNTAIAFLTSRTWHEWSTASRAEPDSLLSSGVKIVLVLIFLQTLAGALMRHMGAGLVIPDFPLSFGRLVPPFLSMEIVVNFTHRFGALVVSAAILWLLPAVLRSASEGLRRLYYVLVGLLALQITLGAWTVWSLKHAFTTSLHVTTGATMLAVAVMLALATHATRQPRVVRVEAAGGEVPA